MTDLSAASARVADRLGRIRRVANTVNELSADLLRTSQGLRVPEGRNYRAVREILDVWSELLLNGHIQQTFAQEGDAADRSLVTPDLLGWLDNAVLDIQSMLRHHIHIDLSAKCSDLRAVLHRTLTNRKAYDTSRLAPFEIDEFNAFVGHLVNRVDVLEEQAQLDGLLVRATDAVSQTEAAAENAAKAAGRTGDDAMSSFYQRLAEEESKDARTFRWLTVFLALIAGGVALMFVLGAGSGISWLDIGSGDYVRLLQKVVLVAGIFGLAGYFARQAHQHRSMANWAGSLAVQLQTFDAYLAGIENVDVRDELRKSFGARVFGDHPAMKGEPTVTPSAAAMDTLSDFAAKIAAAVK